MGDFNRMYEKGCGITNAKSRMERRVYKGGFMNAMYEEWVF
jgi:hypothetical protein